MNKSDKVRKFIFDNVKKHPRDIANVLAVKFNFSRQRAHYYLSKEVLEGSLIKTGRTRWTQYFLANGKYIEFVENIQPGLAEDKVWSKYVKPIILSCPENIFRICAYGFTEIFNNAMEHSGGTTIFSDVEIKNNKIIITIIDNGVGIFNKIQKALNLDSVKEAILHLSKGKFTTDPSNHTGEGIFFTSRMFDKFSILSSDMFYTFQDEDWFLSPEKNEKFGQGTLIKMEISLKSKKIPREIFNQYTDQEIGFGKTIVAVSLSADPNDPHVSRSQAKRLMMGLEKFKTIVLDFKGVSSVGQAFVDEVFRVFQNEHPDILIHYINANEDVDAMIKRGLARF
ncbi:STAS-like domain-containing protein [Patescibacteria group bacterium]|nr:STAS-like domain-containing protein [Patescibacteria group bacterium]